MLTRTAALPALLSTRASRLSTAPNASICYSSHAGQDWMLIKSNLPHQDRFHSACSVCSSFPSPIKHKRSANIPLKSELARRRDYGSVRQSRTRQFRSRSRRYGDRSRYEGETSTTIVQHIDEQKEILPGGEDQSSERSSPGMERTSNILPGSRVASRGTRLEVRLLQRLNHAVKDRDLLRPGQKVLLAVSGGQDSVCLMHLLVKLRSKWGWKIGIAHCDHQWSASAREQAAHVAQMAQGLGLDYYQALTVESVPGEGAARTWRYGVLQRIAIRHGYEAIVTAHTASDRVETTLFNIFRGSGLQGLQSLTWKRRLTAGLFLSRKSAFSQLDKLVDCVEDPEDGITAISTTSHSISLIRPLLDVTRTELRELWEDLKLPLWPDPSNSSLDIDRNRIRHELLPYLRKYFNSGVDKSLARSAEIINGEQEYWDSLCENIRATAVLELRDPDGRESGKKLDVPFLLSLPIALQRRIVKQFSDCFTGKSLGFDIVERVRRACGNASSRKRGWQVSVPGNCYLLVRGSDLIVSRSLQREYLNSICPTGTELAQKLEDKPELTESKKKEIIQTD